MDEDSEFCREFTVTIDSTLSLSLPPSPPPSLTVPSVQYNQLKTMARVVSRTSSRVDSRRGSAPHSDFYPSINTLRSVQEEEDKANGQTCGEWCKKGELEVRTQARDSNKGPRI